MTDEDRNISRTCGTCHWHYPLRSRGEIRGWMCGCEDSDRDGLETAYSDSCEEWEAR